MPYLKIQSNKEISDQEKVLKKASGLVADDLAKPETYVMTAFEKTPMTFSGSVEPAVFMQLKSIGLSQTQIENLTKSLCNLAKQEMDVAKDRVYIEFSDVDGSMWGWNDSTF